MKKIWIRKQSSTFNKIILGITSVMLVLILWISVSITRNPPAKISYAQYDYLMNYKINTLKDERSVLQYKTLIANSYSKVEDKKVYVLNSNRIKKEKKIAIWEVLKFSEIVILPNPFISPNILPFPVDVLKSFPQLIKGKAGKGFNWNNSIVLSIFVSLTREIASFIIVVLLALLLGIFMSCNGNVRAFYMPFLVIGTFIPIAALIPLTQAFFGTSELQKIVFLSFGMFFVLLGLVMKEMDEVDDIYLQTAYTLGFSQLQTVFLVNFPIALPRIWKHFSSVFGLGWGYIIFAEMINQGSGDIGNGIGWLFLARQRRFQIPDMYAIFFIIIFFAFLFSFIFSATSKIFFKYERTID